MIKDEKQDSTIDASELVDDWSRDKEWVDGYTRDFPTLDTLADGVAVRGAKGAPQVGDVTLMNAVRQIPRNSVRQMPVFSATVNGTKMSRAAYLSGFFLRDKVFNQDTFDKGVLSTIQVGAESALTRGFQTFIAHLGNDYTSTMKWVHYNDFAVERGIFDFADSSYYFIRTRVTPGKLKRLIKTAKANPQTTWNVEALEELLMNGPNSSGYDFSQSPVRNQQGESAFDNNYDFITRYGVGPYYSIDVFSPNCSKVLRSTKSRSKFGYPRMQALVIDAAQLSPFGVSRARLASPAANYANIYLQSTAKMQLINADPPIMQKGTFTTPIRLKRGALWKTADPNADVVVKELGNSTLTQFRNVLDFVDGQILSVMGVGKAQNARSSSAYINSEAVKADSNERDLAVQQVTAILENTIRQYGLVALDLFVSEQEGIGEVVVDDECKNAINDLDMKNFVPTPELPTYVPTIGDDNVFKVDWEAFYANIKSWTVNIDLSIGKQEMQDKTRADLQDAVTVASQTTDPNDPQGIARKRQLENKLFETIVPDMRMDTPAPVEPQVGAPGESSL